MRRKVDSIRFSLGPAGCHLARMPATERWHGASLSYDVSQLLPARVSFRGPFLAALHFLDTPPGNRSILIEFSITDSDTEAQATRMRLLAGQVARASFNSQLFPEIPSDAAP